MRSIPCLRSGGLILQPACFPGFWVHAAIWLEGVWDKVSGCRQHLVTIFLEHFHGFPHLEGNLSCSVSRVLRCPSSQSWGMGLPQESERKKLKVARSCPTLCDPMAYTVHGILQARILEWIDFPFSRGSSQFRNRTSVSFIAGGFFTN